MPPQYTPVIPPRPSPEGATSPIPEPPVIPTLAVPGQQPPNSPPNWARPGNPQASPGAFPGFMGTPFVQQAMPMPGSYYVAPVALPQGATTPAANALGNDGLSADWEGYPPTGHPAAAPGPAWGFPAAAGQYTTPYTQPMNFVPAWTTPRTSPRSRPLWRYTLYGTRWMGCYAVSCSCPTIATRFPATRAPTTSAPATTWKTTSCEANRESASNRQVCRGSTM